MFGGLVVTGPGVELVGVGVVVAGPEVDEVGGSRMDGPEAGETSEVAPLVNEPLAVVEVSRDF